MTKYLDKDPVTSGLLPDSDLTKATPVTAPSFFERSHAEKMKSPEFASHYHKAVKEISTIDSFRVGFWYGLGIAVFGLVSGFALAYILFG